TTFTDTTHGSGAFAVGQAISGAFVLPGTFITALGTGTGANNGGTYTVNLSQTVPATQVTGTTALAAGQNIYGIGLPFNTTVKANQTISGSTSTWEIDNPVASVTGTITGTTLTISQVTSGTLVAGQVVGGSGVTAGTSITGQLTSDEADAAPGKTGTYSVSVSHPTTATVTSAATTVAAGTVITSAGFAIDDTVPVVTSITTSTDNSPKAVGATVSIQVGFSEAVHDFAWDRRTSHHQRGLRVRVAFQHIELHLHRRGRKWNRPA
ncbi:MAG: hypothetical protein EBS94_17215, partial [Proteobacteria bacterium]|nr:hypothetical protein [Pseudomonadota bacterium]